MGSWKKNYGGKKTMVKWIKNYKKYARVKFFTVFKHFSKTHCAQWETLCSEGRRKPLNVVLYDFFLHRLKDITVTIKYAKLCKNMFIGSISTSKNQIE